MVRAMSSREAGKVLARMHPATCVVVHPHVEGFDVLRVVQRVDRLLCVLFGQIPLVLRRGEASALSSLVRGGKGGGRGAEGVSPGHREEGNGQHGEGFGAEAIAYWPAGEAAEEGEGDQDAGSKPGRGREADR